MVFRFGLLLLLCYGGLFHLAASEITRILLFSANAEIFAADNFSTNSLGVLTLKQYREQGGSNGEQFYVEISGNLTSILPGGQLHGFHVHEKAPVVPTGCTALGPHYNPFGKEHSHPEDRNNRHVGDLGNARSDSKGNATINIRDPVIQIGTGNEKYDVVGKAIAIHAGTDDLGVGGTNVSKTTGNAGKIMACGSIILQKQESRNFAPTFTLNYQLISILETLLMAALFL